jgi:GNAT superfamily N-acetyltransferase
VKEIPLIVEVALQSYNEHYTYLWTDAGESYMVRNFSPHVIEKELAVESSEFHLLILDNSPVGFLKINDKKALAPHSKEECLELERIYMLECVSGKGVGREAMNFVLNAAKERNRKVVWLKAMDSSLAVKFYKKMGFEITGSLVLDFPYMKDELRNLLVMKKQLKSPHR